MKYFRLGKRPILGGWSLHLKAAFEIFTISTNLSILALEKFYNSLKKTTPSDGLFHYGWFISLMHSQLNYPDIGCISEDFKIFILLYSVICSWVIQVQQVTLTHYKLSVSQKYFWQMLVPLTYARLAQLSIVS